MLHTQLHISQVIFEILGPIYLGVTLIKLLVKIDRPDTELEIIKIGCNLNNEIVGSHITQQGNDTSFIELHKFLCDPLGVVIRIVHQRLRKHIARYPHDMFFHKGLPADQIIYGVGRYDLFQLQTVYPRCIGLLYIKIIVDIVQPVYNSYPEWVRIAKSTVFNAVDVFVLHNTCITRCLQFRINDFKSVV